MRPALALPPVVAERLREGGERVLITGASGWLGQALLEMLSGAFGAAALSQRVRCFGSAPRPLRLRNGTVIEQSALADLAALPEKPSLLFHFAYLTKDKTASMPIADYVERNRSISALTERAAARVGANRVLLSSSGAACQAAAAGASVESVHAYGALKLEDEALFKRHAESGAGRRVMAVRLFNLSGPYINKLDSYALSSFIEQARHMGVIRINAAQRVVRSYTAVGDLLSISMANLLDDRCATWSCVETAGERDVELGDLAQEVRDLIGPHVEIQRPALKGDAEDRYVGLADGYRAMAAHHGIALQTLQRQVRDSFDDLAERMPSTTPVTN